MPSWASLNQINRRHPSIACMMYFYIQAMNIDPVSNKATKTHYSLLGTQTMHSSYFHVSYKQLKYNVTHHSKLNMDNLKTKADRVIVPGK